MRLYSFQDQQAVDAINALGNDTMMFSDYNKSHLYNNGGVNQELIFEAYRWMAEKLAQKTDIYMDTEHGKIPLCHGGHGIRSMESARNQPKNMR